jgi:hypothetical protein
MTLNPVNSSLFCCFKTSTQEVQEMPIEKTDETLQSNAHRTDSSILESAREEREKIFQKFPTRDFQQIVESQMEDPPK